MALDETGFYAEEFALIDEIVRELPCEVEDFFGDIGARFWTDSQGDVAARLNAVAKLQPSKEHPKENGEKLIGLFELLRTAYVAWCAKKDRRGSRGWGENRPALDFAAYERTFVPWVFSPDFWFADGKGHDEPGDRLRRQQIAFERYLFSARGAGAWLALEWDFERHAYPRLWDLMRTKGKEDEAIRHLAALVLGFRAIFAGALNVTVFAPVEISLPMSGLERTSPLLMKCYRYDRHVRLPVSRAEEASSFGMGVPCFARYESPATVFGLLADKAIDNANALSTRVSAQRLGGEVLSRSLKRLLLCTAGNEDGWLGRTIDGLVRNVDLFLSSDDLSDYSYKSVMRMIGCDAAPVRVDEPFRSFGTARAFWKSALRGWDVFLRAYVRSDDTAVARYTAAQMRVGDSAKFGSEKLVEAIVGGRSADVIGAHSPETLCRAMKDGIADGSLELEGACSARLMLGENAVLDSVGLLALQTGACKRCRLEAAPFRAYGTDRLQNLVLEAWSGLPGLKFDLTKVDFRRVLDAADVIWSDFAGKPELRAVREALSINRALRVFEDKDVRSGVVKYAYPGSSQKRSFRTASEGDGFVADLKARARELEALGLDIRVGDYEALVARFRAARGLNDLQTVCRTGGGPERFVVAVAVLARMMCEDPSGTFWGDKKEVFRRHNEILMWANPRVADPYPWHLGFFTDSCWRITRARSFQGTLQGLYGGLQGAGAVQLFGMFVAHYLESSPNADDVLAKITANKNAEAYWRAKSIPSAAAVRLAGLGQNP